MTVRMFGMVQRIEASCSASRSLSGRYTPSALAMEEAVDHLGERIGDARRGLEVGEAGVGHRLGRAEVREEGALPCGADARNLVERGGAGLGGALLAVGADREAVGLVAQALDEVEHRVAVAEGGRRAA